MIVGAEKACRMKESKLKREAFSVIQKKYPDCRISNDIVKECSRTSLDIIAIRANNSHGY